MIFYNILNKIRNNKELIFIILFLYLIVPGFTLIFIGLLLSGKLNKENLLKISNKLKKYKEK